MKFVRELSEKEEQDLMDALEDWDDPDEVRRARSVRMSSKDWTVPQIAEALDVSRWSVRQWIDKYEEDGLDGLRTKPRPGRPPKADEKYLEILEETAETPPRDLGYPFNTWTREHLALHMEKETGVHISPRHMGRLLDKVGFVYKRARHDLSHRRDPVEYEQKKTELNELKKGLSA